MTSQTLLTAAVAVLVLARILWTQSTWRPVDPDRAWRGPLVFGALGILALTSRDLGPVTAADLGVVLVEAAVAVATGVAMGTIATLRPATGSPTARRRGPSTTRALTESRTGLRGVLLWLTVLAVRIGLGVYSHTHGLALASASGLVLVLLALNRTARTTVLLSRIGSGVHALS